MKYYVVYEEASDGGWGAYSPDVPGVGIVASTMEQARESIRKAIEMQISGLIEDGLPLPQPSGEFVEIAA